MTKAGKVQLKECHEEAFTRRIYRPCKECGFDRIRERQERGKEATACVHDKVCAAGVGDAKGEKVVDLADAGGPTGQLDWVGMCVELRGKPRMALRIPPLAESSGDPASRRSFARY